MRWQVYGCRSIAWAEQHSSVRVPKGLNCLLEQERTNDKHFRELWDKHYEAKMSIYLANKELS